jgi:hypothetical protein
MRTCIVIVVILVLALIAPGYTPAATSAQPPCNAAFGNADISELKASLNQLAELQRQDVDTIQFSPENIIRYCEVIKSTQGCLRLFVAPYEMLGVDGGNAIERYIAVFGLPFEDPLTSDLRKAAHLKQKHFALIGFYPAGIWGRIDWRRATISDNQVSVPAESLLCTRYKCCNGGPGFVLIDVSVLNGRVTTDIRDGYNGSDDSSKCP